jgi:uncharacterized repeat protein (TIGR01451 family)
MNPVAAAPVTIDPLVNATVPVSLILRDGGSAGDRSIRVDLQCSSGGTILTNTQTVYLTNTSTVFTFNLTTATPPWTTPITCGTNNSWNLTITNINAGGTVNDNLRLYPYNSGLTPSNSRVELPATTVINVDSITYYDAPYPGGNVLTNITPGQTVYVRAKVSDPFGSYDINANNTLATRPGITITTPSGTPVVTAPNNNMTELGALTTAGTKTFEYTAGYTIPGAGSDGNWTVRVDAVEGTEGTVSDYGLASFRVGYPDITLVKMVETSSNPYAIPGTEMLYTIIATNSGGGATDLGTVVVTDPIPANTALVVSGAPVVFIDGATSSGLSFNFVGLDDASDSVSFSNNGGASYIYTPTPDVNNVDDTITHLRITPGGQFNGSDGTNHPSFTLRFKVRVQ